MAYIIFIYLFSPKKDRQKNNNAWALWVSFENDQKLYVRTEKIK